MFNYWKNYEANEYQPEGPSEELQAFMLKQEMWVRGKIRSHAKSEDRLWNAMGLLMRQFDGLVDGYMKYAPASQPLTKLDIYMLNSVSSVKQLAAQEVH